MHVCVSMWEGLNRGEVDWSKNQWERERTDWKQTQREKKSTERAGWTWKVILHKADQAALWELCVPSWEICAWLRCHTLAHPHEPVSWFLFHLTACKTVKRSRKATHLFMQLFCLAGLCWSGSPHYVWSWFLTLFEGLRVFGGIWEVFKAAGKSINAAEKPKSGVPYAVLPS